MGYRGVVERALSSVRLSFPGREERRRLQALLRRPPEQAARALLGQILVRPTRHGVRALRIVEAEAYLARGDPAAHASRGRTARTEPLWRAPGTVYVYLIYGVHHCLNLAVDRDGVPGCVLIRAAEPLAGQRLPARAARGPGRLCCVLDLDRRDSGSHVLDRRGRLFLRQGPPPRETRVSPRVGIRQAADRLLRFYDADSPAVSSFRRAVARPR